MTRVARRPLLHTLPDSPGERPALRGVRCSACGAAFFPPHRYGCESCGAGPERIEPETLEGDGVLRSFATVHRHLLPEPPTPFVIGLVELDAGPEVEAILVSEEGTTWKVGSRVRGTLVRVRADEEGRDVVEWRFEPADDGREAA